MSRRRFQLLSRAGVIVHGGTIWISELLSIVLVGALLLLLAAVTVHIYFNGWTIQRRGRRIGYLRSERIDVEEELRGLRERYRLVAAVKTVVGERIPDSTQFQLVDLVYRNSRRFGYDPLLVLAVIHVESVFDPRALGRYRDGRVSGALGLMQLKPATAREVAEDLDIELSGPSDLFRPEINIVLGVAYLTRLVSRFESFKLGLLAYNQGPGTIMQDLSARRPLSIRYYRKVLRSYYRLSEEVAEKGPLT